MRAPRCLGDKLRDRLRLEMYLTTFEDKMPSPKPKSLASARKLRRYTHPSTHCASLSLDKSSAERCVTGGMDYGSTETAAVGPTQRALWRRNTSALTPNRRQLLGGVASMLFVGAMPLSISGNTGQRRVRRLDPDWPLPHSWDTLRAKVGGRLVPVVSPFNVCAENSTGPTCEQLMQSIRNPFFIGDHPALTQASGWADGWHSTPSVYAVLAESSDDIAAAVDFARDNHLRLVVKGGGHSYQGTSSAPDSLLVWTRRMQRIELHDAFQPRGCLGTGPRPAVSIGAGALWLQAYDAVTTKAGRYVQGGGCTTVGVAGLIQSGGFGSFSKRYGLAAASLLEAEVVTADGQVRIVNACQDPELFWALKGGGGGTFGIISRVTIATHDLPERIGAVFGKVTATTRESFRRLIAAFIRFYSTKLFNHHWGETVRFQPDNTFEVNMLFQGLDHQTAKDVWDPFRKWLEANGDTLTVAQPFEVISLPARHLWDKDWLALNAPSLIISDDRVGAPSGNFSWAGDAGQVGQFIYGYSSSWLPSSLLKPDKQADLVDAIDRASRHWPFSWHFNKGLAGADEDAVRASRDTAINPLALDAFALAITGAEGPSAYSGRHENVADVSEARRQATRLNAAMQEMRYVLPVAGSYVSESDYFEVDWQDRFWGSNYQRLLKVKQEYDPDGLFFVYHGVGSEGWSDDGFEQKKN